MERKQHYRDSYHPQVAAELAHISPALASRQGNPRPGRSTAVAGTTASSSSASSTASSSSNLSSKSVSTSAVSSNNIVSTSASTAGVAIPPPPTNTLHSISELQKQNGGIKRRAHSSIVPFSQSPESDLTVLQKRRRVDTNDGLDHKAASGATARARTSAAVSTSQFDSGILPAVADSGNLLGYQDDPRDSNSESHWHDDNTTTTAKSQLALISSHTVASVLKRRRHQLKVIVEAKLNAYWRAVTLLKLNALSQHGSVRSQHAHATSGPMPMGDTTSTGSGTMPVFGSGPPKGIAADAAAGDAAGKDNKLSSRPGQDNDYNRQTELLEQEKIIHCQKMRNAGKATLRHVIDDLNAILAEQRSKSERQFNISDFGIGPSFDTLSNSDLEASHSGPGTAMPSVPLLQANSTIQQPSGSVLSSAVTSDDAHARDWKEILDLYVADVIEPAPVRRAQTNKQEQLQGIIDKAFTRLSRPERPNFVPAAISFSLPTGAGNDIQTEFRGAFEMLSKQARAEIRDLIWSHLTKAVTLAAGAGDGADQSALPSPPLELPSPGPGSHLSQLTTATATATAAATTPAAKHTTDRVATTQVSANSGPSSSAESAVAATAGGGGGN
jgi:hypothetical protein